MREMYLIERPKAIELQFQDIQGKRNKLRVDGFLARIIQHEFDHLEGKTFESHEILKRQKLSEL